MLCPWPLRDNRLVVQSSTSLAVQLHGNALVNSANRRTIRSRHTTVVSASSRLRCCACHPASIASNTARSGCNSAGPCTSTRRAEPANWPCCRACSAIPTHPSPALNGCLSVAPNASWRWDVQHQRSSAGMSSDSPTDFRVANKDPDQRCHNVLHGCRMMHLMQFRADSTESPRCAGTGER